LHGTIKMRKKASRAATPSELDALDLATRRAAAKALGLRASSKPAPPKPLPPKPALDAAPPARTVSDIWERDELVQAATHAENTSIRRVRKVVQAAERADAALKTKATRGTGPTILRMAKTPLMQLMYESAEWERGVRGAKKPVDMEKFGSHELEAAQEIEAAFMAISGGLTIKPMNFEKIDKGHSGDWPAALALKVKRYRNWADHWSMMAKRCDPTMQIVIAAVIDQRTLRDIAADLGFAQKKIRSAVVRGLRDYAARSGWVSGGCVAKWKASAALTFDRSAG
jgi:hypothetical protein